MDENLLQQYDSEGNLTDIPQEEITPTDSDAVTPEVTSQTENTPEPDSILDTEDPLVDPLGAEEPSKDAVEKLPEFSLLSGGKFSPKTQEEINQALQSQFDAQGTQAPTVNTTKALLDEYNIKEDELALLSRVHAGDPKAIALMLKNKGIDPSELPEDIEGYTPEVKTVNEDQLSVTNSIENLQTQDPTGYQKVVSAFNDISPDFKKYVTEGSSAFEEFATINKDGSFDKIKDYLTINNPSAITKGITLAQFTAAVDAMNKLDEGSTNTSNTIPVVPVTPGVNQTQEEYIASLQASLKIAKEDNKKNKITNQVTSTPTPPIIAPTLKQGGLENLMQMPTEDLNKELDSLGLYA